uniref:trichoplein keratin filament-binding protein-like n=1 Tax=Styela clava TaxID=7725 RepID=UPI00193A2C85|nr:trichoplein keratin filament-binding protein-like [Styela clava]
MALPTLPSRWRHNDIEKQLQKMHEQQNNFRNCWNETVKYYNGNSVRSSIQQNWTSDHSFRKSMEAYSSRDEKNKKIENLHKRRQKLAKFLQDERDQLEAELRGLSVGNYSRIREMKEKAEGLKSAREEKNRQIAQEKLYEHWQRNNPELRAVDSELHREHVKEAWKYQLSERVEQKNEEIENEIQFANEYEQARAEAIENMRRIEEERKLAEKERAEVLKQQMRDLKEREEEGESLKMEEAKFLNDQIKIEKIEEERKKMEKRVKQRELGRFLHRQYKAQLRSRAQQIQEELELDRQILQRLLEEELSQREVQSARQEKARQDVAWMKQVLEDQIKLEKEREAELDLLYREEARQVWEKREEEWRREREARERLMRDVLDERSDQLAYNMEENRRKQKRLLEEREELIAHLEDVQKTSRQEKREQEKIKLERKDELEQQATSRREKIKTARQKEMDELREQEEAEREYNKFVVQETERKRQIGYQQGQHARRRTAWQ